ncbi:MAG TPA: hypothetical protein VJG13_07805 [Thermoanaerobaculia bacterium]|nr:hypothetical protein [Thermoanaerobaculia bacterium]
MILYLDTSSLVKLYVAEAGSASFVEVLEQADGEDAELSAFDSRLNAAARSVQAKP